MLSAFVIVFRESLEAALIVSIVMAASRGIEGRGRAVAGGIVAGIAGAGLLAAFTGQIAGLFGGTGGELFNAGALVLAVVMLGWHHIWMGRHGAELASQSQADGRQVREGARPLSALAVICAVAVLREGSETVLFLYGISVDSATGTSGMLSGGLLGMAAAGALGLLIYFGLLRIPLKHIFRVTGVFLVLIAAGLAAQAASLLVQAGLLPPVGYDLWDTSAILPQDSALGFLMHILVGYVDRPMGIQVLVYVATLVLITALSYWTTGPRPGRTLPARG